MKGNRSLQIMNPVQVSVDGISMATDLCQNYWHSAGRVGLVTWSHGQVRHVPKLHMSASQEEGLQSHMLFNMSVTQGNTANSIGLRSSRYPNSEFI